MTPEAEIRRRIGRRGPITFAEFMEVALYWPHGGYYARDGAGDETSPFGPAGDYYTSPMAHPAFGALLAVQLFQFWQMLDRPSPFHLIELGAGNGQLARDILTAAASLPDGFSDHLRYICLDRSRSRSVDRKAAGSPSGGPMAERLVSDGLPFRNLRGCILSNELLDAFPVHQVRQVGGELKEVYIALAAAPPANPGKAARVEGAPLPESMPDCMTETLPKTLVEVLAEPSTPALAARLQKLGIRLAEGQTAEINLGLDGWARDVAGALSAGFVVTIDYGRAARELYSPELRPRGTLTTYHRHVQTDAPLRHIGSQDITAQVDFTSLDRAGKAAGLATLGYCTQGRLLRNLGLDTLRRRITSTPLPASQAVANRAGLAALSNPDGLGGFKALVQGKGLPPSATDGAKIWGLADASEVRDGARDEVLELVRALPAPLVGDRHISLPEGWPGGGVQEFEFHDLWAGPFPTS